MGASVTPWPLCIWPSGGGVERGTAGRSSSPNLWPRAGSSTRKQSASFLAQKGPVTSVPSAKNSQRRLFWNAIWTRVLSSACGLCARPPGP